MAESEKATTQASDWTDLCPLADVPQVGGGKFVACKNRALAVFRQGEEIKVIDDTCPHAGGSLASGFIRDGVVHCPWHGWPFRLADGVCPDNPNIKVASYEARIEGDKVQAKL
ncbi:MAG: Rieske (2Fe-2S) protein [Phycisphaeraceae bacterium]|nr:Rieske (2Fe-2S) protein [Phycisphaeraceae bacterium]